MPYILLLFPSLLAALSLEQSVSLALRHNPDLRSIELRLDQSEAALEARRAGRYGELYLNASATHHNLSRTLSPMTPDVMMSDPGGVATTQNPLYGGVAYEVSLFDGMAQHYKERVDSLGVEQAQSRLILAKEQLVYATKSSYAALLSLEALLEAQDERIRALTALKLQLTDAYELGRVARLEKLKASLALQEAELESERLKAQFDQACADFAALIGGTSPQPLQPFEGYDASIIPQATLERFALHEHNQASLQASLELRQSSLPQLRFAATYGATAGLSDASKDADHTYHTQELYQAGLQLRWSLYDFGATKAQSEQLRLALLIEEEQERKSRLEFDAQTFNAKRALELSNHQRRMAQASLMLEEERIRIEQVRFDEGGISSDDLLQSLAQRAKARALLIQSNLERARARFRLEYLYEQGAADAH
ncbi:MAG: TolC family protein [Campylobacterales bacterium]|nr:TolC family protein [Campylobacterales bacterium]